MKHEAIVEKTKEETHDVKTFQLDLIVDFVPGQYCLVSLPEKKDNKPFTFANTPSEKVQLTIKKMGDFTTAMHNLKKGEKVILNGPRGESLNFDDSVKKDVVFLAGGSGITPFISALRYAHKNNLSNNLFLLYSNRTKEDIIFGEELAELAKTKNISVVNTLSHSRPEDWEEETGRIDKEMIEKYVENIHSKLWYICGPPPMVDAMEEILRELEVKDENIRYEDWQIPGKH